MEDKDRPDGRKKGNNPTGKGGFKEKPHIAKKGPPACTEKAKERKELWGRLFREELQLYKDNMRQIALYGGPEDAVRMKATQIVLNYIIDGKLEPMNSSNEVSSELAVVKKEESTINTREKVNSFILHVLDDPAASAQAKLKACEMLEVRFEKNGDVTNNEKLDYIEKLYCEERKARERLENELNNLRKDNK